MTGDYNIQHLPAVTDGSRISTQAVNTRGGGMGKSGDVGNKDSSLLTRCKLLEL